MNVAALLPQYATKNYPELNHTMIGLLMTGFPISFLITAPIAGSYLEKIGRKNALIISSLVLSASTLTFGLAAYA